MSIPLIGVFVRILRVRATILAPLTVLITLVGVYTVRLSVFDMFAVVAFGVVGYLMKKVGLEPGPLVLAFVLGELLEKKSRRRRTNRRTSPPEALSSSLPVSRGSHASF
jgi:putative tricarboxylic transport membrane protein